jgi:Fe-S cluster assembly iron-binding protein IscA
VTLARQDAKFSYALTTPESQEEKSRVIEGDSLEILAETDAVLWLTNIVIDEDETSMLVFMINKITKQAATESIEFGADNDRREHSCVRI